MPSIYGISSKFDFGCWKHKVYRFPDVDIANKWLDTEEYDFREREIATKARAIKLAGSRAVADAEVVYHV